MPCINRVLASVVALLIGGSSSYGQLITVGIDGLQRFGHLSNMVVNSGPLIVGSHTHYFDYGAWVSYERGRNGLRLGIHSFSYRVDLALKGAVNSSGTPNVLSLYSLAYQRNLWGLAQNRLLLYGQAGVGFGRYRYTLLKQGVGTTAVNGTTVLEEEIHTHSEYSQRTVLIPSLRLEAVYKLGKHVQLAAWGSYELPNYLGMFPALDTGQYRYTTMQGSGTGTLRANGSGFSKGISIRYAFWAGHSIHES